MTQQLPRPGSEARRGSILRGALAAFLIAVAVPVPTSALVVGNGHVKIPAAAANASSTLVSVVTDALSFKAGTDIAQATAGVTPYAYAMIVAGNAGAQSLGSAEKTSTKAGERQRGTIAEQGFKVDDLIDLRVASASVETFIGPDTTADANLDLGNADVMNGFATIDAGRSASRTLVNDSVAHVTRTMSFGALHTFSLADLLRAEGSSALNLDCTAIQDLGVLLSVDTSQACAQLADAQSAVDGAKSTLQGAAIQFTTAKNTVLAQIDTAQAAKNATLAQIATATTQKDATVAQIPTATTQRQATVAQLDAATADRAAAAAVLAPLQAQLSALNAQKAPLVTQTSGLNRSAIQAARDTQAALCPTLLAPLQPACNQVVATYDAQLALFTQLDAVNALIAAKQAQVDAATATLALKDASVASLNNTLNAQNANIAALNALLNAQIATIAQLNATLDSETATLVQLAGDLDGIVAGIAMLDPLAVDQATCKATSEALGVAVSRIPSLAAAAAESKTRVDAACSVLTATVESVVNGPLITMDGVNVSVDAIAQDGAPSVSVSGTIGSIRIGGMAPIGVDMDVTGDQLRIVEKIIGRQLALIVKTSNLPLPRFKFMVTRSSNGKRADGTFFAQGSVTTMRIHFPPVRQNFIVVPAPMALINNGTTLVPSAPSTASGFGGGGTYGASSASVLAAAPRMTPDLVLDIGTFAAAATFNPDTSGTTDKQQNGSIVPPPGGGGAGSGGGTHGAPQQPANGGASSRKYLANGKLVRLPHTGVATTTTQAILGFVLIGVALGIRRFIVVSPHGE